MWRYTRRAWISLAVAALAVAMAVYDAGPNRDAEVFLAWVMVVLAFPVSIVCVVSYGLVFAILDSTFGLQVASGRVEMSVTWAGLLICGYAQWFYLAPALWRRYRGRQAAGQG